MTHPTVWLRNDEKGVQVISLTDDRLQEALDMMRESYYPDECVAQACGIQDDPDAINDLEKLTLEVYEDGLSVALIQHGKVAAVAFNKQQERTTSGEKNYFEVFRDEKCKTDGAKANMDLMIQVDSKKNTFEHYGVSKSMEMMFIATARSARKQGLGYLLVQATMHVAQANGFPIITAIFSHVASQRIGSVLKWEKLHTSYMSEFSFPGRNPDPLHNNQSLMLMAHKF